MVLNSKMFYIFRAISCNIYVQRHADYHQHQQEIAQRTFETTEEITTSEKDFQERLRGNSEPRFFGYNKYLASVLLSSLNLLNTVTSFTTTTSTITVATMYNCFKSDLFINSNPTPCRRKRDALSMLLIGVTDENDSTTSFSSLGK